MAKKVEAKKVKRRLQFNDKVRILQAEPVGVKGKEGTFEGYHDDGYSVRLPSSGIDDKGHTTKTSRVVWCEDVEKVKEKPNGE